MNGKVELMNFRFLSIQGIKPLPLSSSDDESEEDELDKYREEKRDSDSEEEKVEDENASDASDGLPAEEPSPPPETGGDEGRQKVKKTSVEIAGSRQSLPVRRKRRRKTEGSEPPVLAESGVVRNGGRISFFNHATLHGIFRVI